MINVLLVFAVSKSLPPFPLGFASDSTIAKSLCDNGQGVLEGRLEKL